MIGQTIDSNRNLKIKSWVILGLCVLYFALILCTAVGVFRSSHPDNSGLNKNERMLINTNGGFYLYPYRYSLIHLPNQ